AQAFNYSTVKDFFEKLRTLLEEHNIPWENIYNMDKKGIQLGGGRKSNGWEFFFSCNDRWHYHIKGGSLELDLTSVTVIKCVCVDGLSLLPGFVFTGSSIGKESTEVDPHIVYISVC
ncbi:hypothetical protein PAXRUDRAFT_147597, partial [Paxillus rubicundulus Ve08.2h10]